MKGDGKKNFSLELAAISFSLQPAPWLIDDATLPRRVRLLRLLLPDSVARQRIQGQAFLSVYF